uniref:Bromodomain adjacent to zinc finger domain protein 1A n=1 Tax=Hirondellea gigas TaxID=1518452 RepID=A0A2P2HYB3_9CRUS
MPLLHKKPFVKKRAPPGVNPNDKVFYCELTNEAFTDYDEYWERLVLCNAMVWTCELTGRPNLTFQEALDCEAKGTKFVASISQSLKRTLLYLASLTRRGRQSDLSEDVFMHCRDRYYPGEPVEAIVTKHWYDCKVIRVITATLKEIESYEKEMADSDVEEDIATINGEKDPLTVPQDGSFSQPITLDDDNASNADSDVQIIEQQKPSTPRKATAAQTNKDDPNYPPYATYTYEVEEELPWDYKTCKRHVVTWEQIRRSKNAITREKCRLFLKISTELSPQGYWRLKESVASKYNIKSAKYNDFFPGKVPLFTESKSKKMPLYLSPRGKEAHERKQKKEGKLRDKKEARDEKQRLSKGTNSADDLKKKGRPSMSEEEKLSRKLERIKNKEHEQGTPSLSAAGPTVARVMTEAEALEQQRLMLKRQDHFAQMKEILKQKMEREKAEKKQERNVKKEESKLLARETKDWLKPREDLQCSGHKALPAPVTVACNIPNPLFGEFLSLLEFLHSFSEVLELTDVYPYGISFEMLENALVTKEVAGVFNDVVQLLLGAVFNLQEEEDDEITADTTIDAAMGLSLSCDGDNQRATAVAQANRASQWATQHHSTSLHQLPLDALTLTEVLRLHLLAAGADNSNNNQWRHMNRGGYKHWDDPGLQFKHEQPDVVKTLAIKSIFDFTIEMKIQVLQVLMHQILTYASVRDRLEETFDKIREVKAALREHQVSLKQMERVEHQARVLKKKEIRQKKQQQEKVADSAAPPAADPAPADPSPADPAAPAAPSTTDPSPAAEEEQQQSEDEEEKKDREDKEEKNRERKKQEHSKKEIELCEQILDLSAKTNPVPLGMDRSYRRYWLFSSVPGLFLEDDEAFPGTCFDVPTKEVSDVHPEACSSTLARLQQQAKEIVNPTSVKDSEHGKDVDEKANTSDKENDTNTTPSKLNGAFDGPHINTNVVNEANRVVPSTQVNLMNVLQPAPTKKLLKSSNCVNGTTKIIQKSSNDQSIAKFFSKSPKNVNGTANGMPEPLAVVVTSPTKPLAATITSNEECVKATNGDAINDIMELDTNVKAEEREIFGLCIAEPKTCPVHNVNTTRPKWFFYHKEEDIISIINGLNDRGERESALKENLTFYASKIENTVRNCPVYILNPTEDCDQESHVRKSRRTGGKKGGDSDTNLNFPLGTPIDHILEVTLRDMILEVEEKLHVGVLGRLQVPDREAWRNIVTAEKTGIDVNKLDWAGKTRIANFKSEIGLDPSDESSNSAATQQQGEGRNSTVCMLAAALLQVAQSVENKYIKAPLAETEKGKKRRLKAERKLRRLVEKRDKEREEANNSDDSDSESEGGGAALNSVSHNVLRLPIERWEASLMAAGSFSQVFLHLATLDNSVTWSRSLTKTRCRVCRKGGDHEKMLLCDGCDKGHHIFCLKPKLKSIPDGDWFCDKCKPKLKAKSPRKNRKMYVEEEEEEEQQQEEQEEEEELEEEEDDDEEEEGNDVEGYEDDFCVLCNTGGSLICCDNCPRSYHLGCVSLKKVPRGSWNCPECCTALQQEKEKPRKSKSNSESPKAVVNDSKTVKRGDRAAANKKQSAAESSRGKKRKGFPDELPEGRASKRRAAESPEPAQKMDRATKRSKTERSVATTEQHLHPSLLHKLLTEIQQHDEAWPFLKPVNKKLVPDYYQLIRKPMDLQTMRERLNSIKYGSDEEFLADGLLVFQNCQQYNLEDTPEYKSGVKLAKLFRKRAIELGLDVEHEQHQTNGKQAKNSKRTVPANRKRQSL